MERHGTLVVATDLSPGGARAVDLAVLVARDLDAPIRLVHAADRGPPAAISRDASPAERALRDRLRKRVEAAQRRLEEERQRVARQGVSVVAALLDGRPWEAIVEDADRVGAGMLVIGPHGQGGPAEILRSAALEWLLGVTADRVIRYASCPVLVASNLGPMTSLRGRPWVVAVDFETPSREALTLAISLARGCDAKVFGVHVLPSLPPLAADAHEGEPAGAGWDPTLEENDARSQLRAFVAAACAEVPGAPPVEVRVTRGDPADDVVTVAESLGAALLVIGTHGRKGLSHALLGSVAERVLRRAKVPVLSVRPRPA